MKNHNYSNFSTLNYYLFLINIKQSTIFRLDFDKYRFFIANDVYEQLFC